MKLEKYAPDLLHCLSVKGRDAYAEIEKQSIDYALMEKTKLACVFAC